MSRVPEILALLDTGMCQAQAAKHLGISPAAVSQALKKVRGRRAGRQNHGNRKPLFFAINAGRNGIPMKTFARMWGVHPSTFYHLMKRRQIPVGAAYFQSLREMTHEQLDRYRVAIDDLTMNHPEAIDYAFDD